MAINFTNKILLEFSHNEEGLTLDWDIDTNTGKLEVFNDLQIISWPRLKELTEGFNELVEEVEKRRGMKSD